MIVMVGQGPNCAPNSPLNARKQYRVVTIALINPTMHQNQARRFVGVTIVFLSTATRPAGGSAVQTSPPFGSFHPGAVTGCRYGTRRGSPTPSFYCFRPACVKGVGRQKSVRRLMS